MSFQTQQEHCILETTVTFSVLFVSTQPLNFLYSLRSVGRRRERRRAEPSLVATVPRGLRSKAERSRRRHVHCRRTRNQLLFRKSPCRNRQRSQRADPTVRNYVCGDRPWVNKGKTEHRSINPRGPGERTLRKW